MFGGTRAPSVPVLPLRGKAAARRARPASLALLLLGTLALPNGAQTARLNAPFEFESVVGDVRDFIVKPNGNYVFYRADDRRAGAVELFAASSVGTTLFRRENRMLPQDGSVVAYRTSAVGNWVVFLADQDADEVFELYSRTASDAAPRKLSGPLVAGGDVTEFALTPDGTRVVYVADQDTDEKFELYGVPIDGSAGAARLSGEMVVAGDVHAFVLSPCSCRVVFHADKDMNGRNELYSAPLDGSSAPVRLNPGLGPLVGSVSTNPPAAISADGTTVVYRADHDTQGIFELFRVPIDGSAPAVQINPPIGGGRDVLSFALSPDGTRVVYTADQDTDGITEIYGAPLDGSSAPVKLNPPLLQPGDVQEFAISPDSNQVVIVATYGPVAVGTGLAYRLFRAALDGSGSQLLDSAPEPRQFAHAVFSPDSTRVVYLVGTSGGPEFSSTELRSIRPDGSGLVRLDDPSGAPASAFENGDTPFALSVDSARVVYLWHPAGTLNADVASRRLLSVPIDRSSAPLTLAAAGATYRFATSPVGVRVFFVADPTGGDQFELYGVSYTGVGLAKISGNLARDSFADVALPAASGSAPPFLLGPTGERVVHAADANVDGRFELFVGPTDGSAHSRPLHTSGIVNHFRLSPDGSRLVYTADPTATTDGDLYSVPADRSASPVKLFDAAPDELLAPDFQISADGARVVFRLSTAGANTELWSVPIAGGAATRIEDDYVTRFVLGAGTDRVVYLALSGQDAELLYSAPLAGGAPPVLLDSSAYDDFLVLSPDGTRVVYERLDPNCCVSVASLPVGGGVPPTDLSGSLFAGSAQITADGQWVVFVGSPNIFSGSQELYSARIDGSLGPLKLNQPFGFLGSIAQHAGGATLLLGSDSTHVVYVADPEIDDIFGLFSVPIDGSASPVQLAASLPPALYNNYALELRHLALAPDNSRVVYVGLEGSSVLQLFSVPLDGSAAPTKLNGELVAGGNLTSAAIPGAPFQISPDSRLVVYRADQEHDELLDLFLVPIDRSREPILLTPRLARGGAGDLRITADSRRVVYMATERNQVTELFSRVLTFDPERGHLANAGTHRP